MSDETARSRIYAEVQSHSGNTDVTSAPADAVLTGFLLIAEWEAGGGERWISKLSGDHARPLTTWRERGLAAEVVHGLGWDEIDSDLDADGDD